jgi:ATP-binding cassette subfamily B protein
LKVDWDALSWPLSRLGEGMDVLARQSGLEPRTITPPMAPEGLDPSQVGDWIVSVADWMGIEAEPVECPYPELADLLLAAGPAVIRRPGGSTEPRYLLVLPASARRVRLVGTDLVVQSVPPGEVVRHLGGDLEATMAPGVDQLLDRVGLSGRRRARTRSLLLNERLGPVAIGECWLLRLRPGESFSTQARDAGLVRHALAFAGAHLAERLLWVGSWWVIGRGALAGRLDWGWLLGWALVVLTVIPFRLAATWYQGLLAVGAGSLLKQRLLHGALRLSPDEIRHQGAGHHLGRVIESEAVESLALSGGLLAVAGLIELILATAVLAAGAGGVLHILLLLAWLVLAGLLASRFLRLRRLWTRARLAISHDLIEKMVGHRTRLAQQAPEQWHEGEDPALARYLELSRRMDRLAAWIEALPRGWLALGLVGLAPAFVSGRGSLVGLAVGLGGMLLAEGALMQLTGALAFLTNAAIAWTQVAPLFRAAAREETSGDPGLLLMTAPPPRAAAADTGESGNRQAILEATEVLFRYHERGEPVLRGCSLRVNPGDRVLLEAPSGGGKSTLVSLLNGLRSPDAGLVLLHGLDRRSWGARGWTRRVSSAPQFHENHVVTETLAFNLLMGRRWPPYPEDLEEAEALCRELGLGELLRRMPSGLLQRVGETGWQLSHGERSRLFMARALLKGADLVVLDESFAALDPDTLRQALGCAARRASTLVVVAHP